MCLMSRPTITYIRIDLDYDFWKVKYRLQSDLTLQSSYNRHDGDHPANILRQWALEKFEVEIPEDEIEVQYIPQVYATWEKLVCTCDENCCSGCKGQCGCEKCRQDYADFLSVE